MAISAAAGIIIQTECDLLDFIGLCEENKHQDGVFDHLNPDVTSFDYDHTLSTVWNISLQTIDSRGTDLLRMLSFLDPDTVPAALLRQGARGHKEVDYLSKAAAWLQVTRELRKHGLCSNAKVHGDTASRTPGSEPEKAGIATHRLLLQTVFHRCSAPEKQTALSRVVFMLKSQFPPVSDNEFRLSEHWKDCHALLPQVEAVVNRCHANGLQLPTELVSVLCASGRYLFERRSFGDAERLFAVAQQVCKDNGLHEWEQAQFVRRCLGGILLESSAFRCDETVRIFRDIVGHYEATLHPEDPVLGVTYSDLAQAMTARGQYDEAIALCERSLAIISKIEDTRSRRDKMFHVHHNMARIYEMKRLPDEALRLHFYQGDAQGNGLRQEHSVYGAWNLYAIGNCLQLKKDPRAMEIHMKALRIRHDLLGDHYYTAISYHKVGQLHLVDNRFEDASEAFREAHSILSDPRGNTEAELARTLWYWSSTKQYMSQDKEAAAMRDRAVCIGSRLLDRKILGKDNWTDEEFDNLVVYYNR